MSAILKDPVWRYARRKMYFVGMNASVVEAAKIMKGEGVGSVLVQEGGRLSG